jgi:hypothetical protein
MNSRMTGPGSASVEELQIYWRMPSVRATRELAKQLQVRRIRRAYPWISIWKAEGLAVPSSKYWDELKHPHCTTADIANFLSLTHRQAQRFDETKPDASFPDPLSFRSKPKLWRRTQVLAWLGGYQVPHFKIAPRCKTLVAQSEKKPKSNPDQFQTMFNPREIIRSADTKNDKMT